MISKIVGMQVERGMLDGYCRFVKKFNLEVGIAKSRS